LNRCEPANLGFCLFSARTPANGETGQAPTQAHRVAGGAGGIKLTPALGLLAQGFRVVAVELPGGSIESNDRGQTLGDLAETSDHSLNSVHQQRKVLG
jgi:hypothetical protein